MSKPFMGVTINKLQFQCYPLWIFGYVVEHWFLKINYYITTTLNHKSHRELSEEYELVKSAQQNPQNFAPLYIRYHDELFLFINKRVDNLEITADITSKVFLKCLKNISKYRYQGVPFSAWLYKIAINEVNQFFRTQTKLQRTVSLNDPHVDYLIAEMDYSQPMIDKNVLISVLLEQLDEYEIQFIELRFFENQSFKQIGYLLGLSEVNAKIKTYRILKKLKRISENINYNE